MPTSYDREGWLTLGGVRLATIARDAAIGTPTYVYDLDAIAAEARELRAAFDGAPHLVAYAVKANTAGAIVAALAAEGCGADVVSGAELAVARACGIPPESIVYSGVAKTDVEIDRAIAAGAHGIGAVQVESLEEIARVEARARAANRPACVSIRVNPAVSLEALDTHAHIATGHDEAKFGIPRADFEGAMQRVRASSHLELVGLTAHIGSQFTSTDAYVEAARALFALARGARDAGVSLRYVDTGGGFGIDYGAGCSARPADFVRAARQEQKRARLDDLALYVEPGRSLVAAHGVLVATVIQPKVAADRRWLMIDAGMNDLVRPALYQALHRIVPLDRTRGKGAAADLPWRVVGPVCESSDDFGTHMLPGDPSKDVAILDAGAYGFTMASQYNGRAIAAEVFLRDGRIAHHAPRSAVDRWIESRVASTRG